MPLTNNNTNNPIRGNLQINAKQREDCHAVIAQFKYGDLGRRSMTLHEIGNARLDMQDPLPGGSSNLQVQVSGGTVSTVLVAGTAHGLPSSEDQNGVTNAVISCLNQSLDSGTVWEVSGSLP